ncbi:MAG: DNA repair exonuclease [Desulfohalobiaceae bacterium]|nr:DNA repair exonuclease [Desulfohalobiaceae bacterium]
MSFSFLHAADIHLDSPLKGLESYPDAPVEQIRNATRRALDNLVDLAISEAVSFVLLAGDIFDGPWRDYNTALFFAQRMGRLKEAGIRVFLVTGNHDAASTIGKNLSPPDNVRILSKNQPESIYLEELGVTIIGQGYSRRDVQEDLAANYPVGRTDTFNIGLLHTALSGRAGHEPYAPTSLDILASKGYDYWALGHVHQREVVDRDPWIVFPGALQGRHIREEGPKGCTLVLVEDGRVKQAVHHDLDVLRWQLCRVDLDGCECEEHVFGAIRLALEGAADAGDGRPVAVRLELAGRTSLHNLLHDREQQVQEECRTRAVGLGDIWLEKISLRTRPLLENGEVVAPDSPLAGLLRSIEELSLPSSCQDQIPELADMLSKLPPEIKNGEDPIDLGDPEKLRQMQDEVKELLLGRLLRQGEGS